jgi:isoleucyl-tRNA synthetase
LIAPILAFTAEEVWKHMPRGDGGQESVHMATFPTAEELERALDDARAKNWDRLLVVREEVLKALEPARAAKIISSGLEARVTLAGSAELASMLRKYAEVLPGLFIVSQVAVADIKLEGAFDSPALGGLQIQVARAQGGKCERCWNYSIHVGENADYPTLCERCVAALAEIERDGGVLAGSAQS